MYSEDEYQAAHADGWKAALASQHQLVPWQYVLGAILATFTAGAFFGAWLS